MTPVLIGLIAVGSGRTVGGGLDSGRTEEGEADGVVVRLIRTVLVVGEDGYAEGSALVGEIDPAVRAYFELARRCGGTLEGSEVLVVGCILVRGGEGKRYFEVGGEAAPVDCVVDLDSIACVSGGEGDGLYER